MDIHPWRYSIAVAGALLAAGGSTSYAGEPADVLSAARTAMGFSDWDSGGFVTESGSERVNGLTGRWTRTADLDGGRSREATNFGSFITASTWDGRTYWRQVAPGGIQPADSAFMQRVHVTDAWITARGYLKRKALGADVTRLEDRDADGHSFAVLRATPRQGAPVELWFDRQSNQLARTVQAMTASVRTTRYDDYRKAKGLVVPFTITTDEGDPASIDVVQVDAVQAGTKNFYFGRPRSATDIAITGRTASAPETRSSRVDVDMAARTVPQIVASHASGTRMSLSSRMEAGNIGSRILAEFGLDVDHGHGKVWCDSIPGRDSPHFDRAGMGVSDLRSDGFKVAAVAAGVSSAGAGLRPNGGLTAEESERNAG